MIQMINLDEEIITQQLKVLITVLSNPLFTTYLDKSIGEHEKEAYLLHKEHILKAIPTIAALPMINQIVSGKMIELDTLIPHPGIEDSELELDGRKIIKGRTNKDKAKLARGGIIDVFFETIYPHEDDIRKQMIVASIITLAFKFNDDNS